MKKKLLILTLALVGCVAFSSAQNRKALRINEVMVENDASIIDEYGNKSAWIELFNANFGPLEISSVYLSNDSINNKKYPVPLGDEKTRMGKRQFVVFFADSLPERGTFHTSFKLTPGKANWIGLYDADGKLIDSVLVPDTLQANQSYARCADGSGNWEVRNGIKDKYVTPGSANVIKDTNNKVANFAEIDGHGFGMAAMAMCIVFSALLILCLAFMAISKIGGAVARKNKAKSIGHDKATATGKVEQDSGEVIAAISMALNQHLYAHDKESTVLTINKVKRAYSPWSSKIYGLRQTPKH